MKRIFFAFFAALYCWVAASAGGLSSWDLANFIGVWEITPSSSDSDVSWVIDCMRSPYDKSGSVYSIELALDANGHGYINYYTESKVGRIEICGTVFTTGQSRDLDEFLYLLSEKVEETGFKGVKPIRVVNGNNGPARPDIDVYIKSVDYVHYAKFRQISTEYPNSKVNQIAESPDLKIQYVDNGIYIVDAIGAEIAVYDIEGILHYQTISYNNEIITLQKGNTYIAKVNDHSLKLTF